MINYPNKDDYRENFWKNNYRILVSAQGVEFVVNANCVSDAIDCVIDYCEKKYKGLLMSELEVKNNEFLEDYIFGGNNGRYFSTYNVHIKKI